MADMEYELTERGSVHISDEVVQIIAGVATNEVDGVIGTSGSLAVGITESITGRKIWREASRFSMTRRRARAPSTSGCNSGSA
ncbi:Asp23/Gls24 family envelope stress response protein [Alicyclobacillus acidocaldarius]|nr:Asp23/Gls24 family envelope stress response protein [Alicyclobacillus acidocaldarius]